MTFARLVAVTMALSLSACASLTPTLPASADRVVSGRISVHYKDLNTDHEESLHGRFDWVQSKEQIELSLLDPLGQSVALIRSNAANDAAISPRSSLTLRDGREFKGTTPEDLSEQALGWRLPLRGLSHWLDGQPAPGQAELVPDTGNTGMQLAQDGWNISYPGLTSGSLPRRLDLSYPGPPVQVELKLVIDERSTGTGNAP